MLQTLHINLQDIIFVRLKKILLQTGYVRTQNQLYQVKFDADHRYFSPKNYKMYFCIIKNWSLGRPSNQFVGRSMILTCWASRIALVLGTSSYSPDFLRLDIILCVQFNIKSIEIGKIRINENSVNKYNNIESNKPTHADYRKF